MPKRVDFETEKGSMYRDHKCLESEQMGHVARVEARSGSVRRRELTDSAPISNLQGGSPRCPIPSLHRDTHDDVPADKKISELHKLIDGINVAMLTTRDAFGRLIARPMATQSHEEAADLWFMTSSETHKVEEIDSDSDVNVSYINGSKEWISISGTARLNTD